MSSIRSILTCAYWAEYSNHLDSPLYLENLHLVRLKFMGAFRRAVRGEVGQDVDFRMCQEIGQVLPFYDTHQTFIDNVYKGIEWPNLTDEIAFVESHLHDLQNAKKVQERMRFALHFLDFLRIRENRNHLDSVIEKLTPEFKPVAMNLLNILHIK